MEGIKITEKAIENSILYYLAALPFFVWKNQSIGVYDAKKGSFRNSKNPFHLRGVSDILGVLPSGELLAIEVKTPSSYRSLMKNYETLRDTYFDPRVKKNKPKLHLQRQIRFIERVNRNGGVAFFTDSLDHCKVVLSKVEKNRKEVLRGAWT